MSAERQIDTDPQESEWFQTMREQLADDVTTEVIDAVMTDATQRLVNAAAGAHEALNVLASISEASSASVGRLLGRQLRGDMDDLSTMVSDTVDVFRHVVVVSGGDDE